MADFTLRAALTAGAAGMLDSSSPAGQALHRGESHGTPAQPARQPPQSLAHGRHASAGSLRIRGVTMISTWAHSFAWLTFLNSRLTYGIRLSTGTSFWHSYSRSTLPASIIRVMPDGIVASASTKSVVKFGCWIICVNGTGGAS